MDAIRKYIRDYFIRPDGKRFTGYTAHLCIPLAQMKQLKGAIDHESEYYIAYHKGVSTDSIQYGPHYHIVYAYERKQYLHDYAKEHFPSFIQDIGSCSFLGFIDRIKEEDMRVVKSNLSPLIQFDWDIEFCLSSLRRKDDLTPFVKCLMIYDGNLERFESEFRERVKANRKRRAEEIENV